MGSIQSHATSNPNSIAQKATVEALLGPQETVDIMRTEFEKRKNYMFKRIKTIPLIDALEPEGAFYVFVDFTEVLEKSYKGAKIGTTEKIADILLEDYHVAVVPCGDFGFNTHIRLSYAISMESIEKGLNRIEEFVSTL